MCKTSTLGLFKAESSIYTANFRVHAQFNFENKYFDRIFQPKLRHQASSKLTHDFPSNTFTTCKLSQVVNSSQLQTETSALKNCRVPIVLNFDNRARNLRQHKIFTNIMPLNDSKKTSLENEVLTCKNLVAS